MKGIFNKTRESIKYVPSEPTSIGSPKDNMPKEPEKQSLGAMLKQLRQSQSIKSPVSLKFEGNSETPSVKLTEPEQAN